MLGLGLALKIFVRNCVKKREQMLKKTLMTFLKDHRNHLYILVIVIGIKEGGVGGDDNGLRQLVQGGLHVKLVHLLLLLLASTQLHRLWQLEDLFWEGEDHGLWRAWVVLLLRRRPAALL